MLCYALLVYVILCCVTLRYVTFYYIKLCYVMGCYTFTVCFTLTIIKKRILVVTNMSIKSRLAGRFSFVPYSYSQYPFGAMRYFLSEKPSMKEDILGSHNMVLLTRLL